MANCFDRSAIVEMLLNALEVERHVRGPLLLNLLDALASAGASAPAVEATSRLAKLVEHGAVGDAQFARKIATIRALVRRPGALSRPT